MPLVSTHDPNVMEVRYGGGFVLLIGLPSLLFGLAMLLMAFGIIPIHVRGSGSATNLSLLFGALFGAVGVVLVFGRGGTIIDRRKNAVIKWYGLLTPLKRTEYPLAQYQRINLSKEVRQGKNSTYTVYPIRLESNQVKWLTLTEPRDYQEARRTAEDLAKLIRLPLADQSAGRVVERAPDQLDESLRERARRTREKVGPVSAPVDLKTQITYEGDATVLDLPPPGFGLGSYLRIGLGLFLPLVGSAFILVPLVSAKLPGQLNPVFIVGFGVFLIIMPLAMMVGGAFREARARVRITVSPSQLTVTEMKMRKNKVTTIPANELEELDLMNPYAVSDGEGDPDLPAQAPAFLKGLLPRPRIMARSDKVSVSFGAALPEDEKRYVLSLIKKVLTQ